LQFLLNKCEYIVIQSVNDGTASENMRIGYFIRIGKTGNSYTIALPKDVRMALDLKKGDYLYVEVKKVVLENESNLDDDNAARSNP